MNICLLNDSFPPVIDGVVNVVMNYADYLRRDYGDGVIVGTPRYPEADYGTYPYPVVPYQSFDTAAVTSGYRTGNPFQEKAVTALAAFSPELIHAHCPASAMVIARLLREAAGAPIVFTYHTKYDIDIERVVKSRLAAREGIRAMVRNIEAADDVWVVSQGAGESLSALGFQGDWRVMPNGVDFQRGRASDGDVARVTGGYDLPAGVPVLLFVGRLMTYKGLPLILTALRQLRDAGQDFRMVFVGKGPDRELLENQAKTLGIGDKCIFTGPVYDREDLRAFNTRADLFLFPSTFDTNGLVVREAAACGLGSVLIRGSCAAEGVTDGVDGFLIDETPEAMAELLSRVLGDLPRLRQVGQAAMDNLYLSWQDCVALARARYGEVLERKRAGALPNKRRLPEDYLLHFTARSMEETARRRKIRQALFHDFRETAVGMMENFQEAGENAEHFWDRLADELRRERK